MGGNKHGYLTTGQMLHEIGVGETAEGQTTHWEVKKIAKNEVVELNTSEKIVLDSVFLGEVWEIHG